MSVAESPSTFSHLGNVAGSTFRSIGHLGFAASHLVSAVCRATSIPFSPYYGTLDTASELGQTVISTASALKEAGSVVVHTASAVTNVAYLVIPTKTQPTY